MAARRWLTARNDWTGLASKFHTSPVWEIGSLITVGLFIVLMFVIFAGPMESGHVALNTFAPDQRIHYGDWVLAAFLSFFLTSNIYRMYILNLRKGVDFKVPLSVNITQLWQLILHFATQKRYEQCDEEHQGFLRKDR